MVCSACGRKADPNRSFCRACGSSVFTDDVEFRRRPAERPVEQSVDDLAPRHRPARPARSTSVQPPPRATASTASGPAKAAAGCLAAIVRLAIFVAIIWYAGKWLIGIPEVRTLLNAFMSGAFSDDQLNAAVTAIRDHLLRLLGN